MAQATIDKQQQWFGFLVIKLYKHEICIKYVYNLKL
jgi:hypothetical protein